MNKIFNINRFGRYLGTDIRSCAASYGLTFMLISLIGVIIYAGTIIMGLIFNGTWEGPSTGFRAVTFGISMSILMVSMPVRCYGSITDKRVGSDWLMVPVSRVEKLLSMVIMTIFIVPAASAAVYLSLDALICAADSTCGECLTASLGRIPGKFAIHSFATDNDMATFPAMADFVKQVSNPALYIDDIIGISLTFLLGAIVFKSSKTVKTFIAAMVITSVISVIISPIAGSWLKEYVTVAPETPESLNDMFNLGIFRHAALIDTVSDTIVNLALLTGIYFRIKTLKH